MLQVSIIGCIISGGIDIYGSDKYEGPVEEILIENQVIDRIIRIDMDEMETLLDGHSGKVYLGQCPECGYLAVVNKSGVPVHNGEHPWIECILRS